VLAAGGTIGLVNLEGAPLNVAQLVKGARHAAQLTQTALAARAGVSRDAVAAVETGARSPSLDMLTGLLAAAGKQMRIELEPLDDDVRQAVSKQAGDTSAADDLSMTVSLMEGLVSLEYRFEGLAAAAMLGAPIPLTDPVDLVLPDCDEAVSWRRPTGTPRASCVCSGSRPRTRAPSRWSSLSRPQAPTR
jgi:transcriptional regulator with XRE-family HTH domain